MENGIQEKPQNPHKRDTRLEIRLTESEYERLKTVSEDYGSVSDYVRKCCLEKSNGVGEEVRASSPKSRQALKEMMVELRSLNMQIQKVVVNLNQTSKHIHFLERHVCFDGTKLVVQVLTKPALRIVIVVFF